MSFEHFNVVLEPNFYGSTVNWVFTSGEKKFKRFGYNFAFFLVQMVQSKYNMKAIEPRKK